MQNLLRVCVTILLLVSVNLAQGQRNMNSATSSANVSTTISRPLTYTKSMETEDGNMFMIVGAMLEISTSTKLASGHGSIVLPMTTASFTAAIFNLNNSTGLTYNVTVPETPLTFSAGTKTMKVTSMSLDPYLSGENGMTAGIFVSVTPYDVIVNYN